MEIYGTELMDNWKMKLMESYGTENWNYGIEKQNDDHIGVNWLVSSSCWAGGTPGLPRQHTSSDLEKYNIQHMTLKEKIQIRYR